MQRGERVIVHPAHPGGDLMPAGLAADDAAVYRNGAKIANRSLNIEVENFKRRLVRRAIEQNRGNVAAAARDLGLNRSNLYNLAKRLGVLDRRGER